MSRLPSALSTVTTAPSIAAPDASVTLPLIEPVACPTAHCPANDMDTKIACNVLVVDKTALSVIGLMSKEAVRWHCPINNDEYAPPFYPFSRIINEKHRRVRESTILATYWTLPVLKRCSSP